MNPEYKLHRFDVEVEESKRTNLFMLHGETPISTVTLNHINQTVAMMTMLFVEPAHRKQGVGKRLVDECLAVAKKSRCRAMSLTVAKMNRAVTGYYIKQGFNLCYVWDDGTYMLSRPIKLPKAEPVIQADSLAHRIATTKAIDYELYLELKVFRIHHTIKNSDRARLSHIIDEFEALCSTLDTERRYPLNESDLQFLLNLTF